MPKFHQGAQWPLRLQLTVLGQEDCVIQSAGFTHAHDAAMTALGATRDATTGIAMADAKPIFLINSLRLGDLKPLMPLSVRRELS